jgi:CPA1 family monovalent cation:H+ antiporter
MDLFDIISLLITLSAIFSYINYRYIKLPNTIGLMLFSLIMSLSLIVLGHLGFAIEDRARELVTSIDFNKALMEGMLSFLLFAGALHVDINDLLANKWEIGIFATFGVLFSTFLIGTSIYLVSLGFGLNLQYIHCLLFGALISPTDPIAVLGILKSTNVPKNLETKIAGESLFNDGIGIVVFITLFELSFGGHELAVGDILFLFTQEALGGVLLGLLIGWITYRMLKSVDNYQVEILITIALVTGGYAIASMFHFSGPIAIVIAGLLIGNHGRRFAMSNHTRDHLDTFWELIDEILNALLFVLIGLEILVLSLSRQFLLAGLIAIPIVLFARFLSVGIPISLLKVRREFSPKVTRIMTWGGLRGGISVALALSLPVGRIRDIILVITYAVVVFSILVQGTTIKYLIKNDSPSEAEN